MGEIVTATQADRDRAADFLARDWTSNLTAEHVRRGLYDEDEWVQTFARHRLASTPQPAVGESLVRWENLAGVKGCKHCRGKGWHMVTVDPDLDLEEPTPCGWCLVPRAALSEAIPHIVEQCAKVARSYEEALGPPGIVNTMSGADAYETGVADAALAIESAIRSQPLSPPSPSKDQDDAE